MRSRMAPGPEISGQSTSELPVLTGDWLQTSFKYRDPESVGLLLNTSFLSHYPSVAV
jgi:hypothetical protein